MTRVLDRLYSRDNREIIHAARTYYVRTDGNDGNTGLVDSAAGAFLTGQHAVDVVCGEIDSGPYQTTIQFGSGTFSEGIICGNYVGQLAPIVQGDTTTPSNVIIDAPDYYNNFMVKTSLPWTIQGFKLINDGSAYHPILAYGGYVDVGDIEFGDTVGYCLFAIYGGTINLIGDIELSGDCAQFLHADRWSTIDLRSQTVTFTGTPDTGITAVSLAGWIAAESATMSGSATGTRYFVEYNGVIYTNGGGANFFPGDVAGNTPSYGGQYI